MAEIRNFSLVGVAPSLQFGKGGVRLVQGEGTMAFMDATGVDYASLQVGDPLGANFAVPRSYVDNTILNQQIKKSVNAATTANIDLAAGPQTIDGVAVTVGQRVLVKDQTVASENGIYVVGGTTWSRATDADIDESLATGALMLVTGGTTNGMTLWALNTANPIVVGTTELTFTQVGGSSGGEVVTAGNGLQKVGSELSIKLADETLEVGVDGLKLSELVSTTVQSNTSRIGDLENNVDELFTTTEGLGTRLTTAEGEIDALQTAVAGLDSTQIVSADGFTKVDTDAVAGQVTIDVSTGTAASRVATFKTGAGTTTSVIFDNAVEADTFVIQADGTVDDVSIHLAPKGAGEVIIGELGVPGVVQADDGQTLTLAGGDNAAGAGGDLVLRAGAGSTTDGAVIIASPSNVPVARFAGATDSTAALDVVAGTTDVTVSAAGDEANIDLILSGKGTGTVALNFSKLTQVADPTTAQDAATKNYVDNAVSTGASKVGSIQTRTVTLAQATANVAGVVKGRVRRVMINVTTAYSAGATFTIGTGASVDQIVADVDFDESTVGTYEINTNVDYAVDTQLVVTVNGSPTVGAATIVIEYVQA